jgi:hypothetical protein
LVMAGEQGASIRPVAVQNHKNSKPILKISLFREYCTWV